jgi:hypothetical protein
MSSSVCLWNMRKNFFPLFLLLAACTANISATPQVVTVYATSTVQPWLAELYDCAKQQSVIVRLAPVFSGLPAPAVGQVSDSPSATDIVLRLGQPANLSTPGFQVDSDDVLVIVNPVRSSNSLDAELVRDLFTGQIDDWGQIDPSKPGKVQVWVFAQGSDMQEVFAKTLAGRAVVSTARLATSPDEMSRAIASDENAVGILSRHWKTASVADVYVAASTPILAITPSEPQGAVKNLLVCLQG